MCRWAIWHTAWSTCSASCAILHLSGGAPAAHHHHAPAMTFTLTAPSSCYRVKFTPAAGDQIVVRAEAFSQNQWAWLEQCTRNHFRGNARNLYRSLIAQGFTRDA